MLEDPEEEDLRESTGGRPRRDGAKLPSGRGADTIESVSKERSGRRSSHNGDAEEGMELDKDKGVRRGSDVGGDGYALGPGDRREG